MRILHIATAKEIWKDIVASNDLECCNLRFQLSYLINPNDKNVTHFLARDKKLDFLLLPAGLLEYPLSPELKLVSLLKSVHSDSYYAFIGRHGNGDEDGDLINMDIRKQWGKVAIVGFGPGDPSLMTKRAENELNEADVIFYDDLVNESYLQGLSANLIYVGKRKGKHKYDQQKINEQMLFEARKGNRVVRIKGGDPLLFGRGAEEYHYLSENFIDTEIIPGISSAFAVASASIIPLTERSLSSSVTFLSGHDLDKLKIPKSETLVFYMGASNQSAIAKRLLTEGWHPGTPVAVIHNVSSQSQKEYRGTIKDLSEEDSGLPSPSIIIVGKTARKYSSKATKWLYTGLNVNDWEQGEDIVHTPMVRFHKSEINSEVQAVLNNVNAFDRIIFKSRYGVECFMENLFELGLDARSLVNVQINSIGTMTSDALRKYGLLIKPVTEEHTTDAFLNYCRDSGVTEESILIPGSESGVSPLETGLTNLGNCVKSLALYSMEKNDVIVKQNLKLFKGVVFTSPATVNAFVDTYGVIPAYLTIKCIGTRTRSELKRVQRANDCQRKKLNLKNEKIYVSKI